MKKETKGKKMIQIAFTLITRAARRGTVFFFFLVVFFGLVAD